ncbi:MAG: hypothetical protein WC539_08560 [Nitrospirota bacterium]
MEKRKPLWENLFLLGSILGMLFVSIEMILQALNKSICLTAGCKLVAQHARFGDFSILVVGFLFFALVTVLAILKRYRTIPILENALSYLVIVALAAEGFFVGYQVFSIKTACVFCLIIFMFILCLAILRLAAGEKNMIAGFGAFFAVFSLLYLIAPPSQGSVLPTTERLVLFYSKDCTYCKEIMKELEENKIVATYLDAADYSGFLKNMNIEYVPTLLVNDPSEKILLVGQDAIRRSLADCKKPKAMVGTRPLKKNSSSGSPADFLNNGPLDIRTSPGILTNPDSSQVSGYCKEETTCQ